jgi:hypothetical protein
MFHVAQSIAVTPANVQTITPRTKNPLRPWWLSVPDEYHECDACDEPCAEEAMFHCARCGCVLCPNCAEVPQASRQVQCSQCLEAHP